MSELRQALQEAARAFAACVDQYGNLDEAGFRDVGYTYGTLFAQAEAALAQPQDASASQAPPTPRMHDMSEQLRGVLQELVTALKEHEANQRNAAGVREQRMTAKRYTVALKAAEFALAAQEAPASQPDWETLCKAYQQTYASICVELVKAGETAFGSPIEAIKRLALKVNPLSPADAQDAKRPGFVLVPAEPTKAMLDAGRHTREQTLLAAWRAMLKTAMAGSPKDSA